MSDKKFLLRKGAVVRMPEGIATEQSRHAKTFRATPVIVRVVVRQNGETRFAVPGVEQGRAMFIPERIQPGDWIVIVSCGPPILAKRATEEEIQRHLDQQPEPLNVPALTGEPTPGNTPRPNHE